MVLTTGWPVRLIPAWAGKTSATWFLRLRSPAHPRMGGENAEPDGLVDPDAGSSPRGRGKLCRALKRAPDGGLIPARAGKTPTRVTSRCTRKAHPRASGENVWRVTPAVAARGSSPRGRGKPPAPGHYQHAGGLIPARAGKTPGYPRTPTPPWAHPRAGGENSKSQPAPAAGRGSSPRGRGKPCRVCTCVRCRGLIPARAGKTSDRSYTVSSA